MDKYLREASEDENQNDYNINDQYHEKPKENYKAFNGFKIVPNPSTFDLIKAENLGKIEELRNKISKIQRNTDEIMSKIEDKKKQLSNVISKTTKITDKTIEL